MWKKESQSLDFDACPQDQQVAVCIDSEGIHWYWDNTNKCCEIRWSRTRIELHKQLIQPTRPATVNWENGIGTDRRPVSVCNCLWPGTFLLHVLLRLNDQSTMVWALQNKGWCLQAHCSDQTTKSTSGICGKRVTFTGFWLMHTISARSRVHRLWRVIPFLNGIKTDWQPAQQIEGVYTEWIHHRK